ncbi:hypothetical protein V5O48_012024 [Marasmius crinis-equi]|uniref:Glycosyl hydrolase family 95 N-terminal domain-containing protein n=1 Tax=Marasmius crinis-equi TaxID=585013 RepID=A0ABR3F3Z7_9AGAR
MGQYTWGVLLVACSVLFRVQAATTLWFNESAIIPIGSGRLGAEVFGQVPTEVLVLNEDRIWSGSMNDPNNPNCPGVLPQIREYIWKDDLVDALNTVQASCMANPIKQQVFQTAGNLSLAFPADSTSSITAYNHSLDLNTAIATTTYTTSGGVQFTRTSFASHLDNVIVMKISANVTGQVEFEVSFTTPMDIPTFSANGSSLTLTGQGHKRDLPCSINFLARAEISTTNGSVSVGEGGDTLVVSGADEAIVRIAIDTNYVRYDDVSGDPEAKVSAALDLARDKTWEELRDAHVEDYSALFGRVEISLGTPSEFTYLPTNIRKNLPGGADADPDLFALYAQYGRYQGIASSRKTEPSNLQGIWNSETSPPWGSKHTLNINQQMNSWLAEPLNIAETLDPLWNMISEMAERGKDTALTEYNITRGWIGHHNTGIWRDSAPIDAAFYGMWPMAPAWMMQHFWEHYAFEPDNVEWVRDVAYPLMKGLSEFYLDFLVAAPKDVEPNEYLVTNPSMSPERTIRTDNGTKVSLTYGSTIDNQLLLDLFTHTAEFATLLNVDDDFAANLTTAASRLVPLRIGSRGQIQEWARDYNNTGGFTHISHMYPLFPSSHIDPRLNETLATAANVSLVIRGDSDAGWPTAWRANCYARLLDGEKAHYYLIRLLQLFSYDNLWSINGDAWQIDANFGGANAVAEMVLQSHNGEIHLLPAIPAAWGEGRVTGFRARGGFTLDLEWSGGALTEAKIKSTSGTAATRVFATVAVATVSVKYGSASSGDLEQIDEVEELRRADCVDSGFLSPSQSQRVEPLFSSLHDDVNP